ncbi:hypothetical protein [Paenibacillus sp. OSY-SE]|nr:hypothetical protein [Paenibacillus sp. OSY-SE]
MSDTMMKFMLDLQRIEEEQCCSPGRSPDLGFSASRCIVTSRLS